jgi:hypothetical protein
MVEKIYTIPVNEAFDLYSGCPHCALYKKLEDNELDTILGAAMMEPDTRIQTNAEGFCGKHCDMMFNLKNRLGLALMIESHLSENINKAVKGGLLAKRKSRKLEKSPESCYVCARIDKKLARMLETTAILWEREKEFREKLAKQQYFCIQHYNDLLAAGEYTLHKRIYPEYSSECRKVMVAYSEKLLSDVSWFVKKFDYRYEDEPWGDSKDAVERAVRFLCEYKSLDSLRK